VVVLDRAVPHRGACHRMMCASARRRHRSDLGSCLHHIFKQMAGKTGQFIAHVAVYGRIRSAPKWRSGTPATKIERVTGIRATVGRDRRRRPLPSKRTSAFVGELGGHPDTVGTATCGLLHMCWQRTLSGYLFFFRGGGAPRRPTSSGSLQRCRDATEIRLDIVTLTLYYGLVEAPGRLGAGLGGATTSAVALRR